MRTYCNFKKNAEGLWACINPGCGNVYRPKSFKAETPPSWECRASAKGLVKIRVVLFLKRVQEAKDWMRAVIRWLRAGLPRRSLEEIKRIFNECCLPCKRYVKGRCTACGCRVNEHIPLLNKIAMATEDCPERKWSKPILKDISHINIVAVPKSNLKTFSREIGLWRRAGKPSRSDKEVNKIYEKHCASKDDPCGYFRNGQCVLGGKLLNRLRMATTACYADPPRFAAKIVFSADKEVKHVESKVPNQNASDDISLSNIVSSGSVDVVYTLSVESRWDDNELRYSLRSVEKNFTDLRRVWIIGHLPAWVRNVVHIPIDDVHKHNKDANLFDKILVACFSGVTEDFVFCSDDQVFLKPIKFSDMRAYHAGNIINQNGWDENHSWWKRLKATRDVLKARGKKAVYHYDVHCPMPFNRETYMAVMPTFNYRPPPGFTINTLYFNAADIPGTLIGKRKYTTGKDDNNADALYRRLQKADFLGYNDEGLTDSLKQTLAKMFPNKSKFEV